MSEMYFYQERGKTVGPFSAEDIKARIREGRIRVFDLLYRDGEQAWRMALEHESLRAEFKSATLATLKDKPWVCLQKKPGTAAEFTTTGPFTQEEIRDGLQQGKISYSDYAWKDSLAEWKRIGSLEEFNPRVRHAVLPAVPSVPQESSADLLKNVVEFQRPTPVQNFEHVPPEADSDFLPPPVPSDTRKIKMPVKDGPPPVDTITRTVKIDLGALESKAKPEAKAPKAESKSKAKAKAPLGDVTQVSIRVHEEAEDGDEKIEAKRQPWFDWSLVGILVLVLIAVVLIVSRFVIPKINTPSVEVPVTPPPTVADTAPLTPPPAPPPVKLDPLPQPEPAPQAAQSEARETEPKPEPTPKPEAKPVPREPRELVLAVHAGSAQPQIELRTDGTAEFPVYVQIIGLPGQVTDGGAYYRFAKVTPKGKLKESLDIPNLKLPQGKFVVRAETTGDLKKEAKFSWGINDDKYKATMSRQRKTWAYALWKERLNLFILAQALEKQVQAALVPSKKFQSAKWEKLIALKRGDGAKYLMFDDWWELHNIAKEAKSGVTGALASRASKERERLSSFSVWK